MNTQHTPGPWHVVNGIEVHDKAAEYDSSGTRIGETPNRICLVEYPYSYPDYRHGATKEANAHLIAAAPDLLTGCEAALAYLADPPSVFPENRAAAVEIIRAALNKAKGIAS